MKSMEEDVESPKKAVFFFYTLMIAAGLIIYLGWGIMFGSWNIFVKENMGVFSLVAVLLGFGVVGSLLYSTKEEGEEDI